MAKIQENIARIQQAKADIKEAIIAKGVEVTDDVRIDGYAEKIGEIQQGGGGQFAVDFGEEIVNGNPSFIGALQDDIDYYNQIQEERRLYAEGKGGRSDSQILTDPAFHEKIPWWPKGMAINFNVLKCRNLYELPKGYVNPGNFYNIGASWFNHLDKITDEEIDCSATTNIGYFLNRGSCRLVDLSFPSVTSVSSVLVYTLVKEISLRFDSFSGVLSCCNYLPTLKRANIYAPNATSINMFRDCDSLEYVFIDMSSAESVSPTVFLYNLTAPKEIYLKGLMCSVSSQSRNKKITIESIKYILDNCQARADGAAYTLTLHANVKAAFMAKCTEGDENYDAEYAATLAAANTKGLTIA